MKEQIEVILAKKVTESERLEDILNSIQMGAYYDMDFVFKEQLGRLKSYLQTRELGVIESAMYTFLVDKKALLHKVNLDCFACTKKYEAGCCVGSPCNYSLRNAKNFKAHETQIVKSLIACEPLRYAELLIDQRSKMGEESATGEKLQLQLVTENGFVGECKGRCYLLVREEGVGKCLAHKYALEKGLSIYELCPLSCLMFPLEFIVFLTKELETIILITSVIEEDFAKDFGRWGKYKGAVLPFNCTDEKAHDVYFKKEGYTPLFKVGKHLFCHEFGETISQGIWQICERECAR